MNQQTKQSIIEFIDAILTFDGWHNKGSVLLFPEGVPNKGKELRNYFDDINMYWDMDKNNDLILLVDALESYDIALEDDWLPNYIIGLPIAKAYLFLKNIKEIILTSEDKNIEDNLIDARNKLLLTKLKEKCLDVEIPERLNTSEVKEEKKEETKQEPLPTITLKSKETVPKTGRYQATLPAGHPKESIIKNSGFEITRKIEGDNIGTFGLSGSDEYDIEWRYVGE